MDALGGSTAPRGGRQRIPRPPGARPGPDAPWRAVELDGLDLSLDAVAERVAAAGPGRRHPIERAGVGAAAVLAPLYEVDGETHVVFTRRSWHLRSHKGEVSFPGGRQDPDDPSLVDTALREAWEETRLDRSAVEVVGELDHLTTVTSRSFIVPYVGRLAGRPALEPNPAEVEAILHLPLRALLDRDAFRAERWGLPGLNRPVYFFEVPGDTIWGATAAMLVNLLAVVTGTGDHHVPGV